MKVAEAVSHMTKAYLHRIIDSFTRDIPKPDEDRSREIIVRNVEELTDPERINTVLTRERIFAEQLLETYTLEAVINRPDYRATEEEIVVEVVQLEEHVLAEAKSPAALKYEDDHAVSIFRAVLEVALADKVVTPDELRLIRKLRQKLGIHKKSQRIILAQMNHFPRSGNVVHSPSEIREVLLDMQKRGVVFYCNRLENGYYVIPEEIVPSVKSFLDIQLNRKGWQKLLEHLSKTHLGAVLESAGLPKSGGKAELEQRVEAAGLSPRDCLEWLGIDELHRILASLPGAKVSGSKAKKIDRIIEYFDRMVFRDVPTEAPVGERYFQFLEELARRDREVLLTNKVIKKDRDIDGAFEEATAYLFSAKLGLDLNRLDGSDHADGCIRMGRREDLLMWDNKSMEEVYRFPPTHVRQFKRYIRDSRQRVACFLVIVPEVAPEAAHIAAKLKVESRSDTDIAVITAANLKWLAEQWSEWSTERSLDPEVFNMTGVLDRSTLEMRMKMLL